MCSFMQQLKNTANSGRSSDAVAEPACSTEADKVRSVLTSHHPGPPKFEDGPTVFSTIAVGRIRSNGAGSCSVEGVDEDGEREEDGDRDGERDAIVDADVDGELEGECDGN